MSDQHILKYLGVWNLNRTISDGTCIKGKAVFERVDKTVLAYREDVLAVLPTGKSVDGVQGYKIKLNNKSLEIYFSHGPNKGKLFQRFSSDTDESSSMHQCVNDTYLSTWTWIDDSHFKIVHSVNGPLKNYLMTTDYFKLQ